MHTEAHLAALIGRLVRSLPPTAPRPGCLGAVPDSAQDLRD